MAIAILVVDHEMNAVALRHVEGMRLGLAGHAWFETYSVLTRLPSGSRLASREARDLMAREFPATRFLDAHTLGELPERVARLGIGGGAVYDALVGEAARIHGLPLLSNDRRAIPTYEKLGVEIRSVT